MDKIGKKTNEKRIYWPVNTSFALTFFSYQKDMLHDTTTATTTPKKTVVQLSSWKKGSKKGKKET